LRSFQEPTDGGVVAMNHIPWKKNFPEYLGIQGIVATVIFITLIIGLFVGSPAGKVLCAVGVLVLAGYVYFTWQRAAGTGQRGKREREQSQHAEGNMKTLLFDDFQAPSATYTVKEVGAEEPVVPSTKAGQPIAVTKEEKVKEFDIADFFDLDSDIFRSETDPRSEFNFLLTKLLMGMKEVLFAHTIAFFWVNREKQQLVLETKASSSEHFMVTKRVPLEHDVVSQVARSGKPQVMGRISELAEKEVVRHYQAEEGVKSLVAVPVYYLTGREEHRLPEGVIIADSKAEDAFGAETLAMLGHFTKMISALIKSYTNKYDLLLDSELLTSIRRLQDRVKSERSEQSVLNSLADEAMKLLSWDVLTITMYSEAHQGWVIQKVVNRSFILYPAVNELVAFENSIVGRVIQTNTLVHVGDLEAEPGVRFSADENIAMGGSFLCVPISSLNRCYGAVALESGKKFHWTPTETEVLYRLVENAAELLEVLYMNDVMKDHVTVDETSGALNNKYFNKKLEEEILRATDFGSELALVSIAIDNMQEHVNRYGKDGFESILGQVVKLVRLNTQPYDMVGRYDTNGLHIVLVNTAANNAYVWAEKVRKHIASNVIELGRVNCAVTVSAGVSGLTHGMTKNELVASCLRVLGKAIESGGNLVRYY
jgi:diguanylate cyclase (GGDEF)-like protein